MTRQEFIDVINAKRKQDGWYWLLDTVDGKRIHVKGYRTWLQRYTVDGIEYGNCCDRKVKEFQADLLKPFA